MKISHLGQASGRPMATTRSHREERSVSRRCYLRIGKGDVLLVFSGIVCSVSCLASPVLAAFEDVIYRRKNTMLAGATG